MRYKHYVREPGDSYIEVFPLGFNQVKFKYENQEGNVYFRRILDGQLEFTNRPKDGVTDYTLFKEYDDNDRCQILEYKIERECDGEFVEYWTGTFGAIDCTFDADRCIIRVNPRVNDLYDCILSGNIINILNTPNTVSVFQSGTGGDEPLTQALEFENCRMFADMLDFVISDTCSDLNGVVSDFFQINPETPSAINYVTGTDNYYIDMAVASVKDIRNPVPSTLSTYEGATFLEIMNDLRELFNVFWFIDEDSNIRIEHITYFSNQPGLNLTTSRYERFVSGTDKYSYITNSSPRYEIWEMVNSNMAGKFIDRTACGNNRYPTNTITHRVTKLYTDYYRLITRDDLISDDMTGIFLFATQEQSGDLYMRGIEQNEELVLPRLIQRFYRFHRPHLNDVTFEYTNNEFDFTQIDWGEMFFYTVKPIKKQEPFRIPLCCDADFEPLEIQLTPMGGGYVDAASLSVYDNKLQLELKYKAESDNQDIESPDDISGLQVWLDAGQGVTETAGRVSSWADQSGNSHNATQGTAGLRPIRVLSEINGLPVIRFDGANQERLDISAFQTFPSMRGSVFVVHRRVASSNDNGQIVGTWNGLGEANVKWDISWNEDSFGEGYKYFSYYDNDYYDTFGMITNVTISPLVDAFYGWNGRFLIFSMIRDSNITVQVFHNGKPQNTNPHLVMGQPTSLPVYIGSNSFDVDGSLNGDIAEIIIYSRDLLDQERQMVEQYLSKKYNLNLYAIN